MPSNEELARATYRQLEALVVVHRAESWADVEHQLSLDKHAALQTIKRLAERLKISNLALDVNDKPTVPPRFGGLVEEAEAIIHNYRVLEAKARDSGRAYWLSCDAYWAHLTHFMGAAIGELEFDFPDVHVELPPYFGRQRDRAGAGLVSDLRQGRFDLVVAPDDRRSRDVDAFELYRWVLVAAVREDHPLLMQRNANELQRNVLSAERLTGFAVLTSPPGHRTRSMVDEIQSRVPRFHVEAASPEPPALVALGRTGTRVPLIASDSVVEKWEPHWPAIILDGELLGGRYCAFFRSREGPARVQEAKLAFAERMYLHADGLRGRVRCWEPLVGAKSKPGRGSAASPRRR